MKTSRWHSCNVLHLGADARQLWQFGIGNGHVAAHTEQRLAPPALLPGRLVNKDWSTLWRGKLNIAWLPPEQVFLRVVHLPKCEAAEVRSMIELRLEKISPLPANQTTWSFELVPQSVGELQAVIVIIAQRAAVEDFLGRLETAGYLADRLELPLLHQLQATPIEGEGAWIHLQPVETGTVGLVAWWYGGELRQVNLLNLPEGEPGAAALGDQLNKIAWAGEIEGWLTGPPRWHLVADSAASSVWEPALRQWTSEPIECADARAPQAMAALTAQRAARSESQANLLPEDFQTRYQQQFIDRLWMGGLAALTLVYLAGVLIYFGALQVLKYQTAQVQNQIAALSGAYEDARQLAGRLSLLQEQVSLKYAALDCWMIASEELPSELTLRQFTFSNGETLRLRGTALAGDASKATDYNTAMSKAALNGRPVFRNVSPASTQISGDTASWSFDCSLQPIELR